MTRIGIVVIGRNEGARLRCCLDSLLGCDHPIVYVDSGSTDGSIALARQKGVQVVELDMSIPFSAARARNAGYQQLIAADPTLEFVQFVDGDCEMVAGWIERAVQVMQQDPKVAAVDGRRRERYPEKSPYNRLCNMEWDRPAGEIRYCGGDVMVRCAAFQQVGGYNPALIAGEEPELCVRLRSEGWKIMRIAAEMTVHDAAMTHFRQWFRRAIRAGHAFAEGAAMHGRPPEKHWVRESRSVWQWAFWVPLLAFGLVGVTHGWSLLLLAGYFYLAWRIRSHCRGNQRTAAETRLFVLFTILGKFPQLIGQLQFWGNRLIGRRCALIEYKESVL